MTKSKTCVTAVAIGAAAGLLAAVGLAVHLHHGLALSPLRRRDAEKHDRNDKDASHLPLPR